MELPKNKKIILFDGVCNLCNSSVQYVIKHDKKDEFRFSALQSKIGQQLVKERGIDTSSIDSIILIEPGIAYYTKSEAALKIAQSFGGVWNIAWLFAQLPASFSNSIYDYVARNRYKWYGKQESCIIPTPALQEKFLE